MPSFALERLEILRARKLRIRRRRKVQGICKATMSTELRRLGQQEARDTLESRRFQVEHAKLKGVRRLLAREKKG